MTDPEKEDAPSEWGMGFSPDQRREFPPSLLKASDDNFFYALKLITGEIIHFEEAELHGDWVTLLPGGGPDGPGFNPKIAGHPCPRGIDVRLDQIVWCADAPDGS